MTSIHAPIPPHLKDSVTKAKHRGEDPISIRHEQEDTIIHPRQQSLHPDTIRKPRKPTLSDDTISDSENDEASAKENNPSLSSTPVHLTPPSPRKNVLGKRPLSVLTMPYPEDPDADMMLIDSDSEHEHGLMTSSEQNISANRTRISTPQRKSPKLTLRGKASSRLRDDVQIYEDVPDRTLTDFSRRFSGDGKENRTATGMKDIELQGKKPTNSGPTPGLSVKSPVTSSPSRVSKKVVGARKVATLKAKPRIGVRRL